MDFMIRFVGHIDERKRPENFPQEIYADVYARVQNEQELKTVINEQAKVFMLQNCMVVPKKPGELEDMNKVILDARWLVPLHMITYITTITKRIMGEIPEINEVGAPTLMDGSKIAIQ